MFVKDNRHKRKRKGGYVSPWWLKITWV